MHTSDDPAAITALPARDRILLTAHRLFYRDGIRATGIDRVIAEAGVTKVTFYRHFPSKNDLVEAYLAYRHSVWLDWFTTALHRHGGTLDALLPTLAEWFGGEDFRGCAFINGVGEMASALPAVVEIARQHKAGMTAAIATLLPPSDGSPRMAQAIALAVDGAIVHAQSGEATEMVLAALRQIMTALAA